jgi:hypothetical protein
MFAHRGVEQLAARRAHNPEVVGSSPTSATKKIKEEQLKTKLKLFFFYQNKT